MSPVSRSGGWFEGLEVVGFVGVEGLLVRLVERIGRLSGRTEDAVRILEGKTERISERNEEESGLNESGKLTSRFSRVSRFAH